MVSAITGAFQKQDIETTKQDIGTEFPYSNILKAAGLREKSISHTEKLFSSFGFDTVLGRGETASLLGLIASPASELLRKLLSSGVIRPVSGMGKGRYRFALPKH